MTKKILHSGCKIVCLGIILMLSSFVFGCSDPDDDKPTPKPDPKPPEVILPASLTVSAAGNATTVAKGGSLTFTATVLPVDATNKVVTWEVINVEPTGGTGVTVNSTTGVVTVAANATATSFGVKATSVAAPTVTNTSGKITISGGEGPGPDPDVLPTAIAVAAAGNVTSLQKGNTLQFNATVTPTDATDKSVTWTVITIPADATGVTISTGGLVTTTTASTATSFSVTATSVAAPTVNRTSGAISLTAAPIIPTSITVTATGGANSVEKGLTLQFGAVVEPAGASQTVNWAINPPVVGVSVNASGVVSVTTSATAASFIVRATHATTTSVSGSSESIGIIERQATGVTITAANGADSVPKGTTLTLSASVEPNVVVQTVTWTIDPEADGVSISSAGVVAVTQESTAESFTVKATSNAAPGVTATKSFTVLDITLTGIELTEGDDFKKSYTVFEKYVETGLSVKAVYDTGLKLDIQLDNTDLSFASPALDTETGVFNKGGEVTITYTYRTFTDTVTVTVSKLEPTVHQFQFELGGAELLQNVKDATSLVAVNVVAVDPDDDREIGVLYKIEGVGGDDEYVTYADLTKKAGTYPIYITVTGTDVYSAITADDPLAFSEDYPLEIGLALIVPSDFVITSEIGVLQDDETVVVEEVIGEFTLFDFDEIDNFTIKVEWAEAAAWNAGTTPTIMLKSQADDAELIDVDTFIDEAELDDWFNVFIIVDENEGYFGEVELDVFPFWVTDDIDVEVEKADLVIGLWSFDDKTPAVFGGSVSFTGTKTFDIELDEDGVYDDIEWYEDGELVTSGATETSYTFTSVGKTVITSYYVTVRVKIDGEWYSATVIVDVTFADVIEEMSND